LTAAPQLAEPIPNRDLDTGEQTRPGAYASTDKTYATLLHKLVTDPQRIVAPDLRQNILDYYGTATSPEVAKDLATFRK
jgi:hypothetical protein